MTMAIFGLVLTLAPSPRSWPDVHARLLRDPRISLGEPCGPRVPLVLELEPAECGAPLPDPVRLFADWPEVLGVDLAFAHLGAEPTGAQPGAVLASPKLSRNHGSAQPGAEFDGAQPGAVLASPQLRRDHGSAQPGAIRALARPGADHSE